MLCMEINTLLTSFIETNPYYVKKEKIDDIIFCTNKYVSDYFGNKAFANKENLNIKLIEEYYEKRNIVPAIYSVSTEELCCAHLLEGYEKVADENWVYSDMMRMEKKYRDWPVPEGLSIERLTRENQKDWEMVDNIGFSSGDDGDNPYSDLDNASFAKSLLEKYFSKDNKNLEVFLIKYNNAYAGCFNLSYYGNVCYMSGLTILPVFRRTKVFLVFKTLLEHLLSKKVEVIYGITENGGYPDKLYRNIGLKVLFNGGIYQKKK